MSASDDTPHDRPDDRPDQGGNAPGGQGVPREDIRGEGSSGDDVSGETTSRDRRSDERGPSEAQVAQARLVIENVPGVNRPADWQRRGVAVFYREGHILVRDEYVDRVLGLGAVRGDGPAGSSPRGPQVAGLVAGVSRVRTAQPAGDALREVVGAFGQARAPGAFGLAVAAPDHLLSITPAGFCPATEPDAVPAWAMPEPGTSADRAAGDGVRVVVVDTGLDPAAAATHTWMNGVAGEADPAVGDGTLEPYAGHGTFIAGVVRCIAPAAEVVVKRVFGAAGAVFESDLIVALEQVLATEHPDVISMSAGSTALTGFGMLGLGRFFETHLRPHKGVVLVTAAGNNGSREPFWPAASPDVVSVGALAANRLARSAFSNFGGWVDVYAPGTDIVNAFPHGVYTYTETKGRPPATFSGMARWSGTSFATPIFAGLVAARMSKTGENGTTAATALLRAAREAAIPGVGAVLLP